MSSTRRRAADASVGNRSDQQRGRGGLGERLQFAFRQDAPIEREACADPIGGQHPDGVSRTAADQPVDRGQSRRIHALQIVDDHEDGTGRGDLAQQRKRGIGDQPGVRSGSRIEATRHRQLRSGVGVKVDDRRSHWPQQLVESGEPDVRLVRCAAGPQHQRADGCQPDGRIQDRRLADAGCTAPQQVVATPCRPHQKAPQDGQLVLPPDQLTVPAGYGRVYRCGSRFACRREASRRMRLTPRFPMFGSSDAGRSAGRRTQIQPLDEAVDDVGEPVGVAFARRRGPCRRLKRIRHRSPSWQISLDSWSEFRPGPACPVRNAIHSVHRMPSGRIRQWLVVLANHGRACRYSVNPVKRRGAAVGRGSR